MYVPASPSFSRSRLTCVSTVRVVTSASMPHTSPSSASRVCTRPRRDKNACSRRNSRAVRVAIDLEPAETDLRRLAVAALHAAEQRADAQDQLAHAERLDDVIVRA